jgi:hypothetical protein
MAEPCLLLGALESLSHAKSRRYIQHPENYRACPSRWADPYVANGTGRRYSVRVITTRKRARDRTKVDSFGSIVAGRRHGVPGHHCPATDHDGASLPRRPGAAPMHHVAPSQHGSTCPAHPDQRDRPTSKDQRLSGPLSRPVKGAEPRPDPAPIPMKHRRTAHQNSDSTLDKSVGNCSQTAGKPFPNQNPTQLRPGMWCAS